MHINLVYNFTLNIGSLYYAVINFSLTNLFLRNRQLPETNDTSGEVTGSSQEICSRYQNLTNEGYPVPGLSRGVVDYRRDYMNTRSVQNSWYNKLRLIQPLTNEWLRNSWGDVEEFGRNVYDSMKRARHLFSRYDKLSIVTQGDCMKNEVGKSTVNTYNTIERPPAAILPSRGGDTSTAENI